MTTVLVTGATGFIGRRLGARGDVAVYLVHSLDDRDFERKDAKAARNFSRAVADAGVRQIVYLGGLGADDGDLSAHLRSRREVEVTSGGHGRRADVGRAATPGARSGACRDATNVRASTRQ